MTSEKTFPEVQGQVKDIGTITGSYIDTSLLCQPGNAVFYCIFVQKQTL